MQIYGVLHLKDLEIISNTMSFLSMYFLVILGFILFVPKLKPFLPSSNLKLMLKKLLVFKLIVMVNSMLSHRFLKIMALITVFRVLIHHNKTVLLSANIVVLLIWILLFYSMPLLTWNFGIDLPPTRTYNWGPTNWKNCLLMF